MANMSPEQLSAFITMQKGMKPLSDGLAKLDSVTYGYGRYAVLALVLFIVFTLLKWFVLWLGFFGGSAAAVAGAGAATGAQEAVIDDV
eukprot:Awhi_evm1s6995